MLQPKDVREYIGTVAAESALHNSTRFTVANSSSSSSSSGGGGGEAFFLLLKGVESFATVRDGVRIDSATTHRYATLYQQSHRNPVAEAIGVGHLATRGPLEFDAMRANVNAVQGGNLYVTQLICEFVGELKPFRSETLAHALVCLDCCNASGDTKVLISCRTL
jgi:hypothetical protein